MKAEGMELGAENNISDLEKAREIARELCKAHGETNADEVGKVLNERWKIASLGPAAGSLFSGREFVMVPGRRIASERKSNHGRELKIWRLVAAP